MSVIGMGVPGIVVFPDPDGAVDTAAERVQFAAQYAGLSDDGGAAPEASGHARRRFIFVRRGGRRVRRR